MNLNDFFTTNNWWGKIIGAFFGYLAAGPTGAFFGIIIGNFFDKGLMQHLSDPHLLYHTEKRQTVQKIFFEATFSTMGHIAKSDGRVTEQEIEMARMLMDEMRLSKEQKTLAKQFFNEGKDASFQLGTTLSRLQKACHDNRELLKLFADIQYRAAQVDGLNSQKVQTLDTVFAYLGFAPLHKQYRFYEDFGFGSQSRQSSSSQGQQERSHQNGQYNYRRSQQQSGEHSLSHAYVLLEVSPDTSKQEVKKAYRRLLSKNHPDKLIAQGLPEEMIKIANDKTQKIMKAYELICQNKGW